ncbi:RNase A-like domain-containing protein [Streptomyces violascens]|uniref:RNase A-like domain-containing protein n=1 Tax=Streptomyces violascens TaxID=67381 RepID=UPI0036B919D5
MPAPTGGGTAPPNGSGPTPSPSPGSLKDPQGNDISRDDTASARRRRNDEVAALKPAAPPDPGSGFDVSPPHLYYTSYILRNQQYDFSDGAVRLLAALDTHAHAGGRGSGPEAFATAYAKIAKRFIEVWAKAVVGVGGAAVGLTVTANNYVRAEYLSDPKQAPALRLKPEPDVIHSPPSYWPAAELGWGNSSGDAFGDRVISDVLEVAGSFGESVLLPVLRDVLRHGKVADITPGGDDLVLPEIAAAWTAGAKDAKAAGDGCDGAIAYITNPASGHSEWQNAMKQFCSSIWGTTAWGQDRVGQKWNHSAGQKPALGVLEDTARSLADACTHFGTAVARVRSEITDVYRESAYKTLKVKDFGDVLETLLGGAFELAVEFINNLDTGRLDSAVDTYNGTVKTLADGLSKLMGPLDEAYLSVPAYAAEEGQAEAVGARALNEFKREHNYTVPQGDKDNHFFAIDLANQESLDGSHPIDKHVGKSDEQLAQRLRDQQVPRNGQIFPSAASTFKDLSSAQSLTQRVLDNYDKADEIERWVKRQEALATPRTNSVRTVTLPFGNEVTGRTVTRSSYDAQGLAAQAQDTHSVSVTLRYVRGLDPPFIVLTSVPTTP